MDPNWGIYRTVVHAVERKFLQICAKLKQLHIYSSGKKSNVRSFSSAVVVEIN